MSGQPMHSADAAWLHMDRATNLMVVNSVMWFDEPMDIERGRSVIRERLVERFPRFRQRIVERPLGLGVPAWQDDPNFDLDRHLHHIALPAPGDRAALCDLVGDLISAPLDRSKPLWDVYVVDGYGAGMAIVTRMHHAIADGIALARVLLSMTDEQPDAGIAPAGPHTGGRFDAMPGPVALGARLAEDVAQESFEVLSHPVSELRGLAGRTSADAHALSKLLLTPPDHDSALRGKLGVKQKAVWIDDVTLEEVKRIGTASRATVNDVLVAAITGALRRYLLDQGRAVDELRAMIPFNLRPLDEPLPRELGNRFGLVYLQLPVGMSSPRRRLREVHRRMEAIKHSPEGAVAYGILGLIGLTPPQVERRLVDVFSSKCTLVLTNVPGPRQPVYFAGTRVAGVVGWVPAGGEIALGVSIFSYDGRVTIGLRVDAGVIPEPERIMDGLERELEELASLQARQRRPPARPPREPSGRSRHWLATTNDGPSRR